VAVESRNDGKKYVLALKARDAVGFGDYISDNLDQLYKAFRQEKKDK